MPLSHALQLGALNITVRELTVREVRDWALGVEQGLIKLDPLASLALEEASLQELAIMVDVKADALEALAPSELTELTAWCRKLNPHFFRLRAAMSGAARAMRIEAQQQPLSESV